MKHGCLALVLLGLAPSAFGQSAGLVETLGLSRRLAPTAEEYASAHPFPLPRVEAGLDAWTMTAGKTAVTGRKGRPSSDEAQGPTLGRAERRRFGRILFDFTDEELRALRDPLEEDETVPLPEKDYGDRGLDFTSSRLIPRSAIEEYPYSAVGKLFTYVGGERLLWCTAAVIARRLILTAGHCVHGGPGVGFYESFQFVPAYRLGAAPYGVWDADAVFVGQGWAERGGFPNSQDWAIVQLADQDGSTVADVVGRLSYRLNALGDNLVHILGYSGDLDDGEEIHQVVSGDSMPFNENTVLYGSDMSGGSSGGPWIQNFGLRAHGQASGLNGRRQVIVGITSYKFTNDLELAQGSSILTEDFEFLRQQACLNQVGNCAFAN